MILLFVFNISFFDYVFYVSIDISLVLFIQFADVNRRAILDRYVSSLDKGHMVLKNISRMIYYDGNDGAARLLSDLKASFVEIKDRSICCISCSLRENKDRDAVFNLINC